MSKLPKGIAQKLSEGVARHVAFHSQYLSPPSGYQFQLPEGHFLLVHDVELKGSRVWVCYALRPFFGGRIVSILINRPRSTSQTGAWFTDLNDRQYRRAVSAFRHAVRQAWIGHDTVRDEELPLLDPLAVPTRITDGRAGSLQAPGGSE